MLSCAVVAPVFEACASVLAHVQALLPLINMSSGMLDRYTVKLHTVEIIAALLYKCMP